MEKEIIRVLKVVKSFKGVLALNSVSLSVGSGEMLGVIGPNGAGKTTLINVINGIYKPDSGQILFNGIGLNQLSVHQIARLGVARTFQIARIFRRLSVLDNLLASSFEREAKERALMLLDFVGLLDKRDQYAFELSGGQQKLLEFARALIARPKVVLMDEPFAGVHPEVRDKLIESIKEMNRSGVTFLVVSHDMQTISELCPRLVVLVAGEKVAEGGPEEVLGSEAVIEAYLGRG